MSKTLVDQNKASSQPHPDVFAATPARFVLFSPRRLPLLCGTVNQTGGVPSGRGFCHTTRLQQRSAKGPGSVRSVYHGESTTALHAPTVLVCATKSAMPMFGSGGKLLTDLLPLTEEFKQRIVTRWVTIHKINIPNTSHDHHALANLTDSKGPKSTAKMVAANGTDLTSHPQRTQIPKDRKLRSLMDPSRVGTRITHKSLMR